jgi:hypothetical protein
MQYEHVSEKAPVAPMHMAHPQHGQDLKQNSDIRRTRTTVFVLLAIQLV